MSLIKAFKYLGGLLRGGSVSTVVPRFSSTEVRLTGDQEQKQVTSEVIAACNSLVKENNRNFAIVHLLGKQWRVTDGDLIVVEGYWPPTIGDQITLDKVLLAGSKDFSLIGRPLVQSGLVNVTATVISKALSHTRTNFRKKRRKQFMRINFVRSQQTMLRINAVQIADKINSPSNVF